jgi:carbon-monoxide dehydrogenase medium subunit
MKFEQYIRASSLEECIGLLQKYGPDAKLLAGGTDLVPRMRAGTVHAKILIDIARLPELSEAKRAEGGIFLGAALRLRALSLQEKFLSGALAIVGECAGHVSSMQIRNVATLGGNSCNASPSADTVPSLLLLDAIAHIRGAAGLRELRISDFLLGPGKTALAHDEVLLGFFLPNSEERTGAAYCKFTIRGDSDITIVGSGALLTLDKNRRITRARLALASVGPTTLRMREVEKLLQGEILDKSLFEQAGDLCSKTCSPISDQRADAAYRREMVAVWSRAALELAGKRAS